MNEEETDLLREMFAAGPEWTCQWQMVANPAGGTMWALIDSEGKQRMFCGDELKQRLEASP